MSADSLHTLELEMDLILMILAPFPIGWFIRHRLTAYVVYLFAFNFLFTFQSTKLITEWAGGSTNAFGSFPKASSGEVWSYGVVNLVILAAGLGLLSLGHYLAARRHGARVVAPAESPVSA